jgi:hypothetical protein
MVREVDFGPADQNGYVRVNHVGFAGFRLRLPLFGVTIFACHVFSLNRMSLARSHFVESARPITSGERTTFPFAYTCDESSTAASATSTAPLPVEPLSNRR